jgi:hypothetical protein
MRSWRSAVRYHRRQARPDGCVATCFAMAQAHRQRGDASLLDVLEAENYALLAPLRIAGGVELNRAAAELDLAYDYVGEPDPAYLEVLRVALADTWAVALMIASEAERAFHVQHPDAVTNRMDNLRHAVVLIGVDGDAVVYLDPYYSTEFQPLRVSWREFANAWLWALVWV